MIILSKVINKLKRLQNNVISTQNNMRNLKHLDTRNERDTNARGSPNPWVTSTKWSHLVTFVSLKRLQSTTSLLPYFLIYEKYKSVKLKYTSHYEAYRRKCMFVKKWNLYTREHICRYIIWYNTSYYHIPHSYLYTISLI